MKVVKRGRLEPASAPYSMRTTKLANPADSSGDAAVHGFYNASGQSKRRPEAVSMNFFPHGHTKSLTTNHPRRTPSILVPGANGRVADCADMDKSITAGRNQQFRIALSTLSQVCSDGV